MWQMASCLDMLCGSSGLVNHGAMSKPLVLGIEAEASVVSALLADVDGTVLGVGRAAGANPTTYPLELVADRLTGAVTGALNGTDPDLLGGAVLGLAGLSKFSEHDAESALERVWQRVGLHCPVRVVANPVVAFSAGTAARRGAVLIAGTGSIAAWIEDGAVTHRIDGHGWLVGDDGSGFWLGRQAVRAVLAELDGRGEPTLLRAAVLGTVTGSDDGPDTQAEQLSLLRSSIYSQPPIALARFAPLVPAAAEAGDRVAQRIVDRAVTLLVNTFDAVFDDLPGAVRHGDAPIVLSGQLLCAGGRIQREVRRRIGERYGRTPVVARNGAGGAAWLALHDLVPGVTEAAHTHLI
jgi:glucosamine kinase